MNVVSIKIAFVVNELQTRAFQTALLTRHRSFSQAEHHQKASDAEVNS